MTETKYRRSLSKATLTSAYLITLSDNQVRCRGYRDLNEYDYLITTESKPLGIRRGIEGGGDPVIMCEDGRSYWVDYDMGECVLVSEKGDERLYCECVSE